MPRAFLATALTAWAFTVAAAGAMPIARYDRMSMEDQGRYVTLLQNRTIAYLDAQGRNDDARTLALAFNGDDVAAESAFSEKLETARALQEKTGKAVEVEYAMSLVLKEVGVQVPESVLATLASDFVATGQGAATGATAPPTK